MSEAKNEVVPEDSLDTGQLDKIAGGGGHEMESAEAHLTMEQS